MDSHQLQAGSTVLRRSSPIESYDNPAARRFNLPEEAWTDTLALWPNAAIVRKAQGDIQRHVDHEPGLANVADVALDLLVCWMIAARTDGIDPEDLDNDLAVIALNAELASRKRQQSGAL